MLTGSPGCSQLRIATYGAWSRQSEPPYRPATDYSVTDLPNPNQSHVNDIARAIASKETAYRGLSAILPPR